VQKALIIQGFFIYPKMMAGCTDKWKLAKGEFGLAWEFFE
jgi:hypothetical protein